jgi:hypothetical protein
VTKPTSKRRTSSQWFIKVRGSYLPNNKAGWLTYLPYVGYTLGGLVYVLSKHYDVVLSTLLLVPNWAAAAAVMTSIAKAKS